MDHKHTPSPASLSSIRLREERAPSSASLLKHGTTHGSATYPGPRGGRHSRSGRRPGCGLPTRDALESKRVCGRVSFWHQVSRHRNVDSGEACTRETYLKRAWCRAEILSFFVRRGPAYMYFLESPEAELEPMLPSDDGSLPENFLGRALANERVRTSQLGIDALGGITTESRHETEHGQLPGQARQARRSYQAGPRSPRWKAATAWRQKLPNH